MENVVLFVTALLMYLVFKRKYGGKSINVAKKKKRRIPFVRLLFPWFPFRLPLIDGLYNSLKLRDEGIMLLENQCKKHGSVFETDTGSITTLVVADASITQKVLCSTEPSHMNKPKAIYDWIFVDFFKDGLVNSEYEIWSSHRKMLSRCFTFKSFLHYVKIMNRHSNDLVTVLKSLSVLRSPNNNNIIVDGNEMFDAINCKTTKILAQIVLGIDKYSDEELAEFTQNFYKYKHLVLERLLKPYLQFPPVWYFHPKRKLIKKYRDDFEREVHERMREFHDDIGVKPFRCAIEEMLCCQVTEKEIYDEVGTLMATGIETSLIALQMLLLHLALNPEHQSRCREEVDEVFKGKNIDSNECKMFDVESAINMDDLANMKYLERCIFESGRITASAPALMRRLDSPLTIDDDFELPAGTNIALIPWALHRSPEHFPDPEKFDPDRFLPENVKARHPYAYVPFSAGIRNCIGWKLAMMELKIIVAWLLRNFEICSTDGVHDVKLLFEATLHPQRNYNISLKGRKDVPF